MWQYFNMLLLFQIKALYKHRSGQTQIYVLSEDCKYAFHCILYLLSPFKSQAMSWFYGTAVVCAVLKVRKKADVWHVGRNITCQDGHFYLLISCYLYYATPPDSSASSLLLTFTRCSYKQLHSLSCQI